MDGRDRRELHQTGSGQGTDMVDPMLSLYRSFNKSIL